MLEEELLEHHKQLEEIGNEQRTIFNDVIAKEEELNNRREQIAADLTAELLQCQWSELGQLQDVMAAALTANVTPATPALATPGSPNAARGSRDFSLYGITPVRIRRQRWQYFIYM